MTMNLLVELEKSFHDGTACVHHPATMSLTDSPGGSLAQGWSWQLSDRTHHSGNSHNCLCEWRLTFLTSSSIYKPGTAGTLFLGVLDTDRHGWVSELLKLLVHSTTAIGAIKITFDEQKYEIQVFSHYVLTRINLLYVC